MLIRARVASMVRKINYKCPLLCQRAVGTKIQTPQSAGLPGPDVRTKSGPVVRERGDRYLLIKCVRNNKWKYYNPRSVSLMTLA